MRGRGWAGSDCGEAGSLRQSTERCPSEPELVARAPEGGQAMYISSRLAASPAIGSPPPPIGPASPPAPPVRAPVRGIITCSQPVPRRLSIGPGPALAISPPTQSAHDENLPELDALLEALRSTRYTILDSSFDLPPCVQQFSH